MTDFKYNHYGIDFIWDYDKNVINKKKHGISFETAVHIFEDDLRLEFVDEAHSTCSEIRYQTIGLVHDILTVVYTERINESSGNEDIRIISARHATAIEAEAYNNIILGR